MSDCVYSFFDLCFDPEGKVSEKDYETPDSICIVTENSEIKSLKIRRDSSNITKFEPVKYDKGLLLQIFHTLMKKDSLKQEVIEPVKQHISGKDENFYISSSFAIFLALCNVLSVEFNSPMFSEELFVKVNFSDNKWAKVFTKFWNIWSQIVLGNGYILDSQADNQTESEDKTYEESKDSESVFEKQLQEALSEGGIEIPVVIEMVRNISQKQVQTPKIVEIKDDENKQEEQVYNNVNKVIEKTKIANEQVKSDTKQEQKYQDLIDNMRKFEKLEKAKLEEDITKDQAKIYIQPEEKWQNNEIENHDLKKDDDNFKEQIMRKINRLERQVLSITEIVKKIVERIS